MKGKRRSIYTSCFIFSALLMVWLFCLPYNLFKNIPYSTVVNAKTGELLGARIADDGQWRFPPCDSIPEKFKRALIEYEDRSFYSHFGISIKGLGRATWQNITNGKVVSGGSTITMQTIRLHRRGKRNIIEKMIEMFMATRMEFTYSKEQILRMYVSHAPFGGNIVGIDAALWKCLGNEGNEMSWAEAATLAVLQNAPSSVHLSKNRDKLLEKRNRLLKRLFENGELDEDEYSMAIEEPLIVTPNPMPQIAPHLVEHLNKTAHGKKSETQIDFSLQKRLEAISTYWRNELSLSGVNDLSIVISDVETGNIIGYCGNADINSERSGNWVDIARAPRSSGSILKPLLYCAALQEGIILPNTILPDIPTDFGGFFPKNFDGQYAGVVDAKSALALSLNIPNVWLLKEFGVSRFASILQKCGMTTLTRPADQYGLSLILGGAEVTLVDVVNCYSNLARYNPDFPLNDSIAIYSMLEAMRDVNRPDQMDYSRISSLQNIAWKTGTSYGARDGWAIGVTPKYVVGVWVGNADGSGVADLTGARTAGPIMFDIFNLLPNSGWFQSPLGQEKRVCRYSGHLAGKDCDETFLQKVPSQAVKSKRCAYCTKLPVTLDGLRKVVDAAEPFIMKSYFLLPPVHKYYFKQNHADFEEPPILQNENSSEIRFIYPSNGAVIYLPCTSEGNKSEIICKVAHNDSNTELFWHLDHKFVGSTSDIHQLRIQPSPGYHILSVMDNFGNKNTIEIVVK